MFASTPPDSTPPVPTVVIHSPSPVKIPPLKAVLGNLPPDLFPSHHSSGQANLTPTSSDAHSSGRRAGVAAPIPSSSAHSTIVTSPERSNVNSLHPSSSQNVVSLPRLPSTTSLLRPSAQAQSIPGLSPHTFSPPSLPNPLRSAPFPLQSRPPSELEWFSPSRSRITPSAGGGGGGGSPYGSSSAPLAVFTLPGPASPSISRTVYSSRTPSNSNPYSFSKGVTVNSRRSSDFGVFNSRTIYQPITEARLTKHPFKPVMAIDPSMRLKGDQGFVRPEDLAKPYPCSQPQPQVQPQPQPQPLLIRDILPPATDNISKRTYGPIAVHATLWEDELAIVLSIGVNGIPVARRIDNNWINCTKLLNVAGLSRGKRDMVLKLEEQRQVFRKGAKNLAGVWLPIEKAVKLATDSGLLEKLYPLFEHNIVTWMLTPANRTRTGLFLEACRSSTVLQEGDGDLMQLVHRRQKANIVAKDQLSTTAELECLRRRKRDLLNFLGCLQTGLQNGAVGYVPPKPDPPRLSSSSTPLEEIREVPGMEEEEEPISKTVEQDQSSQPTSTNQRVLPSSLATLRRQPNSSTVADDPLQSRPSVASPGNPSTSNLPSIREPQDLHPTDWFDNNPPPASNEGLSAERTDSNSTQSTSTENAADRALTIGNDDETLPSSTATMSHRSEDSPPSPTTSTTPSTASRSRSTSVLPTRFDIAATPLAYDSTAPTSRASTAPLAVLDAVALALERDFPSSLSLNREQASKEEEAVEEESRPKKRQKTGPSDDKEGNEEKREPEEGKRSGQKKQTLKQRIEAYRGGKNREKSKTRPAMRGQRE